MVVCGLRHPTSRPQTTVPHQVLACLLCVGVCVHLASRKTGGVLSSTECPSLLPSGPCRAAPTVCTMVMKWGGIGRGWGQVRWTCQSSLGNRRCVWHGWECGWKCGCCLLWVERTCGPGVWMGIPQCRSGWGMCMCVCISALVHVLVACSWLTHKCVCVHWCLLWWSWHISFPKPAAGHCLLKSIGSNQGKCTQIKSKAWRSWTWTKNTLFPDSSQLCCHNISLLCCINTCTHTCKYVGTWQVSSVITVCVHACTHMYVDNYYDNVSLIWSVLVSAPYIHQRKSVINCSGERSACVCKT